MDFFQTIILSVVEGLTEFLPISSTGHLILTSKFLSIQQTDFIKSFEIIIQLGSIFAIIFLYRKTLIKNKEIWKRIIAAFIPTAIIGFILYKVIKTLFLGNPIVTLLALFAGGFLLVFLEKIYKEKDHHKNKIEEISIKNAFLIGLFQSISVIPGISRSAATIIPALFLGTKRKTAVEFSFLLAIPTIFAASMLEIIKSDFSFTTPQYRTLIMGFAISFLVAIISVKFFLKFIQKHTFVFFGFYRIILAVLFGLYMLK